jgi:aspartate-semialdehyde dehydrogenase
MTRTPCAVLGATGLVGQHLVRLLADHPWFEVAVLGSSASSAGKPYAEATTWQVEGGLPPRMAAARVVEATVEAVVSCGARVVFSALPATCAGPLETALRAAGVAVLTNANAHRGDADVPILVPEVNADHLALAAGQARRCAGGFIIAGPNCSTSGLTLALAPLVRNGIRTVHVSTYQAISGGGRRGVAALEVAGNVLPLIRGEEEKLARESVKILGSRLGETVRPLPVEVVASCARVAVRDGHLEAVTVELEDGLDEEAAIRAWTGFRGRPQELGLPTAPEQPVVVIAEPDRPQPVLDAWAGAPVRARGMAVTVGRVRRRGRHLSFYLLVHNAVRGAAGGCVLNAELALAEGLIPGASRAAGRGWRAVEVRGEVQP